MVFWDFLIKYCTKLRISFSLFKHPYWYNMHKTFQKILIYKRQMNIAYTKAWELVIRNAKKQIPWQLLQIQYHKKNLASSSESSSSSISASPALVLFSPRICFSTILTVSESPGYNRVLAQDPMATWALNVCGLVLCWRWLTSSLPTENARSASTEDAIQKV